jgi:choline kinase
MRGKRKQRTIAIILAASRSARLRPLAEETPKCVVYLIDETLLDYQMRRSAKLEIEYADSCKL